LLITSMLVLRATRESVMQRATDQIAVGRRVVLGELDDRSRQLSRSAAILTRDFGLERALATKDSDTIGSMIVNHGSRIGASRAFAISSYGSVSAAVRDRGAAGADDFPLADMLGVAVNLSAVDVMDDQLQHRMQSAMERYEIPNHLFSVEVTESAVLADIETSVRNLEVLKGPGIGIAIDDLGTGQSSLAQHRRLPVDELKIDKSFVMALDSQEDDLVIVRSTIDLGHHMGRRVVAEGIETDGEHGCSGKQM
jgi:hypothetical protein